MENFVRNEDGSVNIDETVEAYRKALISWVDENEIQSAKLEEAVNKVFESSNHEKISLSTLVGIATHQLGNINADNFKKKSKQVKQFILDNTTEETDGGLYCASKGVGGGYYRNTGEVAPTEPAPPIEPFTEPQTALADLPALVTEDE